jgi:hypothetical protein
MAMNDSPETLLNPEDKENNPFLSKLFVGQQIDVLDTVGRWTEAEVNRKHFPYAL